MSHTYKPSGCKIPLLRDSDLSEDRRLANDISTPTSNAAFHFRTGFPLETHVNCDQISVSSMELCDCAKSQISRERLIDRAQMAAWPS